MSKHNFGYFIHEGVSNMFSHGFMSFAAIGITVACLLIMGTFTLVAVNANGLLKDLERENEMLAFVEEDFQEPQSLQQKLEAIPNVVSATFEGLKSLRTPEQVAAIRGKSVEEIVG